LEEEIGFYYLHSNGNLIYKPSTVVDDDSHYFDSPFVKHVWRIDTKDRASAWRVVLEGPTMHCSIPRAKELAEKWGLTFEDSINLLKRTKQMVVMIQMREGLSIFIKEILGMEVDEYWKKVKEAFDESKDRPAPTLS
jgi:hypothetical protein